MEKSNSSNHTEEKMIEFSNKHTTASTNCNTKKRIHSEMININNKLFNEKCNIDYIEDTSSNSITKKFENLEIKKQFKVNKNKSISKYFVEKPNKQKENYLEGKALYNLLF